jgi:hypothetical protein
MRRPIGPMVVASELPIAMPVARERQWRVLVQTVKRLVWRRSTGSRTDKSLAIPFAKDWPQAAGCITAEPSSVTRAGHLPARSVGHDMAYKIAGIALHVVQEIVK